METTGTDQHLPRQGDTISALILFLSTLGLENWDAIRQFPCGPAPHPGTSWQVEQITQALVPSVALSMDHSGPDSAKGSTLKQR